MFQSGTDQALDDQLQRPRAAVPTAPGFSFMDLVASPFQGLGGAGAKTLAFGAEITGAFGQVAGAYPELMGPITLSGEQKKQAEAQRRKLLTVGVDYSSEAGDIFRQRARDIMPDPATTHASAQIVAGLTEFMTQAVGYTATMGPAGALLLGADVGLSESDRLKAQGVDLATRTKAGAVAGVVAGGSVVVPMSGATALTRFAKGAGVGEASMIGQSAAEKAILQNAGYDKIADTFDPLDPVALAMGLVPGVLGAKFGKPRAPVVLKNEADMRAAAVLEPERAALEAQQESSASNLRELERAVAAEKNPKNRAALQAELDHQRSVAAEVAANPDYVHAARVQQTAAALDRSRLTPVEDLAGADAHVKAVETAMDQIGRGDPVRVSDIVRPGIIGAAERDANFRAWFGDSKAVDEQGKPLVMYHGTVGDFDTFKSQADAHGWESGNRGIYFSTDPKYAEAFASRYDFEAKNHDATGANVAPVHLRMKNPKIIEPSDAAQYESSLITRTALAKLQADGYDGIINKQVGEYVVFDPKQIKSAIGNSGRFDPASASLTDPLPRFAAAVDELSAARQPQESARAPKATEAPNPKAAAPARGPGEQPAASGSADTRGTAAGLEADGATSSAVDRAASQVEALNPDMLVQLDGMDVPMRVSDLMKRIKEEAATDLEEAQLIQAAVECALRN